MRSRVGRLSPILLFAFIAGLSTLLFAGSAPKFQPVPPDELALKEVPGNLGVAAVILFRESTSNDNEMTYSEHFRIKILTEEGRKYGDVEIKYAADDTTITDLSARVIAPDGTATDFNGEVHEKVATKKKGEKIVVKSIALPNVQVGSIVEYRYTRRYTGSYVFPRLWDIQSDLFTRRAHFVFIPYRGALSSKSGKIGMIRVTGRHRGYEAACNAGVCDLVAENIPPFVTEDYMPAERDVALWTKFIYATSEAADASSFWPFYSQRETSALNKFIGQRAVIKQEADRCVASVESSSDKLRKIYECVQRLRNTSFEPRKTAKELKSEKANDNVEDVLKNGGTGKQINLLFIAMARSLGFDSGLALLQPRSLGTFDKEGNDPSVFDANVAWVILDGSTKYYDPATKYCPFGLLPWEETDAGGIRLGGVNGGGGEVITTPPPRLEDAIISRTGTVALAADGTLKGTVKVSYEGTEGLLQRLAYWNTDAVGRGDGLAKELQSELPEGAVVKLDSLENFDDGNKPLIATFSVEVPSFARVAGNRLLTPEEMFSERMKDFFVPAKRVNAIDWDYPYRRADDFVLQVPAGLSIEAIPDKLELSHFFGVDYSLAVERQGKDAARIQRQAVIKKYKFAATQYAGLRAFFQKMIAGDQQQIILKKEKSADAAAQ